MAKRAAPVVDRRSLAAPELLAGQLRQSTSQVVGGPVDRTSPVPLYFQIAENLKAAIQAGDLQPGDRLDNEIQLSERLSVSRPTVRQAIQRLTHEGMVVRQRGVGTVVVNQRIQRQLALSSLYEDLRAAGREPSTKVLSVKVVAADEEVANALGIEAGDSCMHIERLRVADGHPLAVMRNYLPVDLLQDIDPSAALAANGLYETLRQRGIQIYSAEEVIGARKATPTEAGLLEAPRNSAVLTMTRVAIDAAGRVIECGQHAYLAERYSFRVTLGPANSV